MIHLSNCHEYNCPNCQTVKSFINQVTIEAYNSTKFDNFKFDSCLDSSKSTVKKDKKGKSN